MDNKHAIGTEAIAVTPSDSTVYSPGIIPYIGVAGDLAVIGTDNGPSAVAVVYKNYPVGWFPLRCRQVMATGTTATNISAGR